MIQEVSFEFITCKISGNEGHVWVASTVLRHDKNGKTTSGGGRDMLTLWYIEKVEDDWCVVKVIATP